MCITMVPASAGEALGLVESLLGSLAGEDAAGLPAEVAAERLRVLERVDAVGAALRGRYLPVFDAQDGPVADGQRTARSWLVHCTRVTKGQAAEHKAVEALARDHPVLAAALAEGWVLTKSVALQLARWTRAIPRSTGPRRRRSRWPPPGPGRAFGAWRGSARRSGPGPPGPTPTMTGTRTWTAGCRSRPPLTAPGSCAGI